MYILDIIRQAQRWIQNNKDSQASHQPSVQITEKDYEETNAHVTELQRERTIYRRDLASAASAFQKIFLMSKDKKIQALARDEWLRLIHYGENK